ncbi:MAG: glycosyltransferase [bacterium]|nr:glycosyltransferase [bacterium]
MSETSGIRCSVVIPCHNGADLTAACLQSLLTQHGVAALEILLVDNASSDRTADLGALDPRIRVLRQPRNLGFAGGVNAGLRAAQEPLVVVLNNDTQATENLLVELHRALVSSPDIGASAPISNFVKGPAQLPIAGTADAEARTTVAAALQDQPFEVQDVDTLAGLCLMLRRETLDEVGEFDERFGNGNFEDDDFCLRLRLRGYRLVIARRAFLHHEGHATFRSLGLDLPTELRERLAQFETKWSADPAGRAVLADRRGDRALAAAEAATARAQWPSWPDAAWYLGRAHTERGEHDAAADQFAALLAKNPYHSEAALELALSRLLGGDEAGARDQLRWAMANCYLPPATLGDALRRIARHFFDAGAFDAAADSCRDALELSPDNGELINLLGSCQLELGELAAAAASFRRAIDLDQPLAHTNLGICEFKNGNLTQAAEHFERACVLLPKDPVARTNLAAFQQQLALRG